jgi:DNA-binding NarL/FixJ family response regulator
VRTGMEAVLEAAPDVRVVAAAGGDDHHEIAHALYRTAPDVVMIEDAPGRADGVALAREIKALGPRRPRVLLLADRPEAVHVASAILAEVDGIVDSSAQPRELLEGLRTVASGGAAFPPLGLRERGDVARRLDPDDHAILAMRLAETPRREIADTLRMDAPALRRRVTAMIDRLRAGAATRLSASVPRPRRGAAPGAAG